jgi:hypothetical protein
MILLLEVQFGWGHAITFWLVNLLSDSICLPQKNNKTFTVLIWLCIRRIVLSCQRKVRKASHFWKVFVWSENGTCCRGNWCWWIHPFDGLASSPPSSSLSPKMLSEQRMLHFFIMRTIMQTDWEREREREREREIQECYIHRRGTECLSWVPWHSA